MSSVSSASETGSSGHSSGVSSDEEDGNMNASKDDSYSSSTTSGKPRLQ